MRCWLLAALLVTCLVPLCQSTKPSYDQRPSPSRVMLAALLGANPEATGTGGGTECAGCTAIVALVEQLAFVHSKPVVNELEKFCERFPPIIKRTCDAFVENYGAALINLIELEETPDRVCQTLGVCTLPTCNLFPPPLVENTRTEEEKQAWKALVKPTPEGWNPLKWIDRFIDDHEPLFDLDGDKFSDHGELRGSMWRGKDCDDFKKSVYPGRQNSTFPVGVDHDCNGIYGHNANGTSFEELYCSGTPHFGQAILGDSAAAHFHIPPEYIMPEVINSATYDDLVHILANEFDWPMMSATTGYTNNDWMGHPRGPVVSSYQKALARNRCTFRDFQNIGVNGARTSSMAGSIMYSFARDQENDYPVNLMYALIGNDVCNPHPNFDHMTTPEEFYTNVVTAMEYLDTQLPMGSNVIFMGLADGLILYEAMAARIHPIGQLRQDVTYEALYNYLNCLEVSPCWGWMNSNATVRNETQVWADSLSLVYQEVMAKNSYEHFDMTYIDCPVRDMVKVWEEQGGEAWQLIEPADGFHPNQIGNGLIAEFVWNLFSTKYPSLIPPENPHNAEILKVFGDQGGY